MSSLDEIRASAGERVRLIGRYQEVDVRMKRTGPPVYRGHVTVTLADGTAVFLEPPWSEEALRPDEERAEFRGKRVAVSGIAVERCPEDPQAGASFAAPCLIGAAGVVGEALHELLEPHPKDRE